MNLGAPSPCSDPYSIIRQIATDVALGVEESSSDAIVSSDNSLSVVTTPAATDITIDIVSTDDTVTITPPTAANPGQWDLSVPIFSSDSSVSVDKSAAGTDIKMAITSEDGSVTVTPPTDANPGQWDLSVPIVSIEGSSTIDVDSTGGGYVISFADGAIVGDPPITVTTNPDNTLTISSTMAPTAIDSTASIEVSGTGVEPTPFELSLTDGAIVGSGTITATPQSDGTFVIGTTMLETPYPANVRFVSPSWTEPVVPNVHYTTIAQAYASILAENPAPSDVTPYNILIYPGVYSEALTMVSNVYLIGTEKDAIRISGAMSWTQGAGVNAPLINNQEEVMIKNILMSGGLTTNSTAKPLNTVAGTRLEFDRVTYSGPTLTLTGRRDSAGVMDVVRINTALFMNTSVNQAYSLTEINNSELLLDTYSLTAAFARLKRLLVKGGRIVFDTTVMQMSTISMDNAITEGNWTTTSSTWRIMNCSRLERLLLQENSLGYIFNTPHPSTALLADATSSADRSWSYMNSSATVANTTVLMTIPLKYITNAYEVTITPITTATAGNHPAIVSKSATQIGVYSLTSDAAGGYRIAIHMPNALFNY